MESLQKRWNEWISSFKKKNASVGDEKANIKSAQIFYVVGPPGTGKVSVVLLLCARLFVAFHL